MNKVEQKQIHDNWINAMADNGKLIESGFMALRLAAIPADASNTQVREMRMAFMSGAQHLFASIVTFLDAGQEATELDLRRMTLIHEELEAFAKEMAEAADRAQARRQ